MIRSSVWIEMSRGFEYGLTVDAGHNGVLQLYSQFLLGNVASPVSREEGRVCNLTGDACRIGGFMSMATARTG
jgi:hypothetical protein